MLNQFDGVTAPHPPHILQRFMPLLHVYGDLEIPGNMYRLVDDVCSLVELNPVPWHIRFNREQVVHRCRENTLFEIFRVIYDLKAEQEGVRYWVCKSMTNVNFFRDLESFEVKPLYIHLIRDGRDVSCSFRNAIVGDKHIYNLAEFWRKEQQACLDLQKRVGADRLIRVQYESLIRNPEKEMMRIAEFLGVHFTPHVFDYYKSSESRETANAGKMWQNLTKPIIKSNFNKYKRQLSREEILLFEHLAGDILQKFDYKLDYPEDRNKIVISKQQIMRYDQENVRMKEEAFRSADKNDLDKRTAQRTLLENIAAGLVRIKEIKYSENYLYEKRAII